MTNKISSEKIKEWFWVFFSSGLLALVTVLAYRMVN